MALRCLATRATAAALLRRPPPPPPCSRPLRSSSLGGGYGGKRRKDDHFKHTGEFGDSSSRSHKETGDLVTPVAIGSGTVLLAAASGGVGFVLGVLWCEHLFLQALDKAIEEEMKMQEASKGRWLPRW